MTEFPMARIDFAARFVTSEMTFTLLGVHRGADSVLRIQLAANLAYGSDLYLWTYGGWDQQSNEYRPRGWSGVSNPWSACDYWGPLRGGATQAARFCGGCGTARSPGGRFCGNCGEPFAQTVGDLPGTRGQVEDAVRRTSAVAGLLSGLISSHSLAELGPMEQAALSAKIVEACASTVETTFIDGAPTQDRSRLTLASAQDLAVKVAAGRSLDAEDERLAEKLLMHAPLHFGWWGPFKAVLKRLDPGVIPQAYGQALARLHSHLPMSPSEANECEDISLLASVFNNPTPGTANYMRRRVRRELALLAMQRPAVYATVATSMLEKWDSDMMSTSFAPAYVLLGDQPYMDVRSRAVVTPVDQSIRRYAHPEVWSEYPDGARELVGSVRQSVETFTFARQVLADAGAAAPDLTVQTVPLALKSTDRSLRHEGQARLAHEPGCWETLPQSVWMDFFRTADESDVVATVSGLLGREKIVSVTWAASELLSRLLSTDHEEMSAIRNEALARVYLAYTASDAGSYRWSRDADVAAIFALGMAHDLSLTADAWKTILGPIPIDSLLAALILISEQPGARNGSTSLIAELVAQPAPEWQIQQRMITCLATGNPSMRDLAWRLLAQLDARESPLSRISDWLKASELDSDQRAATLRDLLRQMSGDQVAELMTSIVSDAAWGLDHTHIASLISGDLEAATLLWKGLEAAEAEVITQLIDSDRALLVLVGDSLSAGSIMNMSERQVRVVQDYLRIRTDRIAQDPAFGLALARLPLPDLQTLVIEQLSTADHLSTHWLALAESGLPIPQAAAWNFVGGIQDSSRLTETVLAAIDSPEPGVRDFGLRTLDERRGDIDLDDVWAALVHSDDPVVQARVVEESLVRVWDDEQLSEFDKRLLVTRRVGRRSKEQIKSRIQRLGTNAVTSHRLEALSDMASGRNARDREWALQRLAQLCLAGVDVDDVSVSPVSQEVNHG